MALKATAWRGVLIAQFGEYFDDALWLVKAISGEAKTVVSVHGRSWTFFLTGDVQCARVSKPLQASASEESRRRPDAAGARPFR